MLFHADIPNNLIYDEDKLVEQLYIFLRNYVRKTLVYETSSTRDDCIQDAIMYLLERISKLDKPLEDDFNLEKWLYNRARSFVTGNWLKQLNRYRYHVVLTSSLDSTKGLEDDEYTTEQQDDKLSRLTYYSEHVKYTIPEHYIDYELIASLIKQYKLHEDIEIVAFTQVDEVLKMLGSLGSPLKLYHIDVDVNIKPIVTSILDEYILNKKED